jgi:DNA or RNA helicases of superfamily II
MDERAIQSARELPRTAEFLWNNHREGRKVLTSVEEGLQSCDEFIISVAFINRGGLQPLIPVLDELETRGVKGKILTTDYLLFNDPKVLDKINAYSNIDLRMYRTGGEAPGFHTKGYIFNTHDNYRIIVGSSNLTNSALMRNKEWNVLISSKADPAYVNEVLAEFTALWTSEYTQTYEEFISDYKACYNENKQLQKDLRELQQTTEQKEKSINLLPKLMPNSMQWSVISNVKKLVDQKKRRGLLISATGTGKTYAAAFSMREINPNRVLFLVHREQIARQAKESFERVLGVDKSYGLISGSHKDFDADYVFSTMQMMGKSEIHHKFTKDHFDIIIIDEVHRAGASSYQKIIDYFEPKFLMGMTASPERTDGYDIFSLFDNNLIYEIRLQQALEENLLCPFNYYGLTDLLVNDEVVDTTKNINFNHLIACDRVDHIIAKAEHYGHSGDRVKGLVFCSRKDEARALSAAFNERGYRTAALSGDDSQDKREAIIERLITDQGDNQLDYIFSVDIFNEGIDIPAVNQIIMLRPTESPIVFVQQLGRGLRKANQKEFVVILDFIGNYTNNFMIPMALSGDKSYNKDTLRRYVEEGNRVIPGCSTIYFDKIAKERIYKSIDTANFMNAKIIKEAYIDLKNRLGCIPSLSDFDEYGSIDVRLMFASKVYGSYHAFKKKVEKDYNVIFTKAQENVLEFISRKLASGKRPHELLVIKELMRGTRNPINHVLAIVSQEFGLSVQDKTYNNLANVLTNQFASGSSKNTYKDCVFIEQINGVYEISSSFASMLENEEFKYQVEEVVNFGLHRYEKTYKNHYKDSPFTLYEKYDYEDACRLLEWAHNEVPLNIGGYKYHKETNTYPVFINYEKEEDISDTINYEDKFLSPTLLQAISKVNRTIQSDDVQAAIHADERNIIMDLFVRKNKDDKGAKEFYYLGRIHHTGQPVEFTMTEESTAVELQYQLETPVRADIYDYIVNC